MEVSTTGINGNTYVKVSDLQKYLTIMARQAGIEFRYFAIKINHELGKLKD